jgi:hypothetical protein
MHVWVSGDAIRRKYGPAWATKILDSAGQLGTVVDVGVATPDHLRAQIGTLPANETNVLIGGYDIFAPFTRTNPTFNLGDDDATVPTDTPYAAAPGQTAEEFVPQRIIARIPDATGSADPAEFIKVLGFQAKAVTTPTPSKVFEECASEFIAAARVVSQAISGRIRNIVSSPPATMNGAPDVVRGITGAGRMHVLLHGADFPPDWADLYGHQGPSKVYPPAISAQQIDLCDLRGAVVTFSSCYAAMLDIGTSPASGRSDANQVALACLGHGAKFVVAATRSNWISVPPGNPDALGPGLIAETWRQLLRGKKAGAAVRDARIAYVRQALSTSGASERPYVFKTALQMQIYGNPEAKL